jgi:hypothetical protein
MHFDADYPVLATAFNLAWGWYYQTESRWLQAWLVRHSSPPAAGASVSTHAVI